MFLRYIEKRYFCHVINANASRNPPFLPVQESAGIIYKPKIPPVTSNRPASLLQDVTALITSDIHNK